MSPTSLNPGARVKICGITNVADALQAAEAGADAIGLVFYSRSPRHVGLVAAAQIARAVGPFVTVVGLFVDASASAVEATLQAVPLQVLQFHGSETEGYCQAFARPYIKALRMRAGLDVEAAISAYPSAVGILLDAYKQGVPGGTGETFDWQRVPGRGAGNIVLAGGLTADNILTALAQTDVYGVDVSGGVEARPGEKDFAKVAAFVRRAKTGKL